MEARELATFNGRDFRREPLPKTEIFEGKGGCRGVTRSMMRTTGGEMGKEGSRSGPRKEERRIGEKQKGNKKGRKPQGSKKKNIRINSEQ